MITTYIKNGILHFRNGDYKFKQVNQAPLSYLTWCMSREAGMSNEDRGAVYDVIRSKKEENCNVYRSILSGSHSFEERKKRINRFRSGGYS